MEWQGVLKDMQPIAQKSRFVCHCLLVPGYAACDQARNLKKHHPFFKIQCLLLP